MGFASQGDFSTWPCSPQCILTLFSLPPFTTDFLSDSSAKKINLSIFCSYNLHLCCTTMFVDMNFIDFY